MGIITRMRKQICVYWGLQSSESGGLDYDEYGQPVYTDPIELECRWEDRSEEFIDPSGTRMTSAAVVYVDQDVDVGGVLMLGELEDITDESIPKENEGAHEIRAFNKLPNLRATEFLRTAYL